MKFILFILLIATSLNTFSKDENKCRPRSFKVGDTVITGGFGDGVAKIKDIDPETGYIMLGEGIGFSKDKYHPPTWFCLYQPLKKLGSIKLGMVAMKYDEGGNGEGKKVVIKDISTSGIIGARNADVGIMYRTVSYNPTDGSTHSKNFVPYVSVKKYGRFRIGEYVTEKQDQSSSSSYSKAPKEYKIKDITKEGYILTDEYSSYLKYYSHYSKFDLVEPKISHSEAYNDLVCDMESGESFSIDKFIVKELDNKAKLNVKFEIENNIIWGLDSESGWIELNRSNFSQDVLDWMMFDEEIPLDTIKDIFNRLIKEHSLKETDKDLQIKDCYLKGEKNSFGVNDEDRSSSAKSNTTPKSPSNSESGSRISIK